MKNDDIEGKALANIMQLDMFFSGPDYMKLIETSQSGTASAKKNAETLIEEIGMLFPQQWDARTKYERPRSG